MEVDEPGRDVPAVGVDRAPRRAGVAGLGDRGDAVAVDRDVGPPARRAGAVDDGAVGDDEIVGHGQVPASVGHDRGDGVDRVVVEHVVREVPALATLDERVADLVDRADEHVRAREHALGAEVGLRVGRQRRRDRVRGALPVVGDEHERHDDRQLDVGVAVAGRLADPADLAVGRRGGGVGEVLVLPRRVRLPGRVEPDDVGLARREPQHARAAAGDHQRRRVLHRRRVQLVAGHLVVLAVHGRPGRRRRAPSRWSPPPRAARRARRAGRRACPACS